MSRKRKPSPPRTPAQRPPAEPPAAEPAPGARVPDAVWFVAPLLAGALGLALVWLAYTSSGVCPAVEPVPPGCDPEQRGWLLVLGHAVVLFGVGAGALGVRSGNRRAVLLGSLAAAVGGGIIAQLLRGGL